MIKLLGEVITSVTQVPAHYGTDGVPDIHELRIGMKSGMEISIEIDGNGELSNWAELMIRVRQQHRE